MRWYLISGSLKPGARTAGRGKGGFCRKHQAELTYGQQQSLRAPSQWQNWQHEMRKVDLSEESTHTRLTRGLSAEIILERPPQTKPAHKLLAVVPQKFEKNKAVLRGTSGPASVPAPCRHGATEYLMHTAAAGGLCDIWDGGRCSVSFT